jgi:anti-sigma B factor antagonist
MRIGVSVILDIQQRHVEPNVTVLAFSGRLQLGNDLGFAEHKIRKLVEEGRKNLVFDFSKLESIDSAGLGMVLLMSATTRDAGGQFRLVAPNDRVATVLKTSRVYELLSVHADIDTALSSISAEVIASPSHELNES